ncbi:CHAP domain-containing protein [uncultured Thiocystis sp.]|jgi:hypothetical protein|uniref:CHAP domain-containing protein n=1 Tax=uncultured Thiocystis sp. TaxID=1202134 RepID=UPI0025FE24C9|nr:CHAP domain-containing protein [uncultured Thiocystis sp.]
MSDIGTASNTKATRYGVIVAALVLCVWVIPLTAAGLNGSPTYRSYSIEKPDSFVDLETWVEDTCYASTASCLAGTLEDVDIKSGDDENKKAVGYVTEEDGVYYRNTVVDDGLHLAVYVFADPELQSVNREGQISPTVARTTNSKASAASCDSQHKCNCVLWVRNCRASWLPTGMTYIWEKKAKKNESKPASGRVAIHDIYYPYGHVSYVKKVDGSKITIEEANYSSCKVTSRTKKPSEMGVYGYIKK